MNKRNRIPKILLVIFLALIGLAGLLAAAVAIIFNILNQTNGELVSSGEKRTYLLYVPKSYQPSVPAPLVISIHGFAEWPAHQKDISHWNRLADENGFIVVYPSGTSFPLRWRTSGPEAAGDSPVDVVFISALIDRLQQQYNIDKTRIYANGLSNGGGMSFLLSCKLAGRIAAIGGVAGAYSLPWSSCAPARPVPLIAFHGTNDPIVSFNGSSSAQSNHSFPSIPEWIKTYASRNGCAADSVALPSFGTVTGIKYTTCSQNADVVFYTIPGGGHSWPGGDPLPEFIVGRTSQEIDATQVMWEFFKQHPLK